jgi:YbgC/YbaW family acyl-CoA thioester hydrolase
VTIAGHLTGIRVLDATRYTPGGYCTMLLADAGADVIKVERPADGDSARWTPPPAGAQGIPFYTVNRNKRSVEIDLASEEGRAAMHRLVQEADVVVESFRPGVAERLAIGPGQLQAVNPSVISCSISGYGQTGPLRGRPGHDVNYMARTGALGMGRDADGRPVLPGVWVSDYATGLMAAFAIASALIGRERTGRGEVIDIGMADVVTQWLGDPLAAGLGGALTDWPSGGRAPGYGVYRTADRRFMAVGAEEPEFWRRLCLRLDKPALAESDPMAVGEEGRRLRAELEEVFASRTRAAWEEVFSDDEVPCDPVLDLEEARAQPQLAAREMLIDMHTLEGDRISVPGFPIKYRRAPCAVRRGAPALGEHNDLLGDTRDAVFEHRLRARYDEADVQGVVHNPRYLAYADIAFVEWSRALAGSVTAMQEGGTDVVVAEARVRFLRAAHADDLLDLRLRVRELSERSMTVETAMYRDDELLVVAALEYVFVDPATLRPKPFAADWQAKLARYLAREDSTP